MLLIDGTNALIRLNSAASPSCNKHEMFVRMIAKRCKQFDDWNVLVAWDISPSQYRLALYPAYKCYTYEYVPDFVLRERHKLLNELHERVLPCVGIKSVVTEGVEADDIIAVACKHYANEPKIIISTDRDYLQLITENTSVYDPTQDAFTDAAVMLARYDVADIAIATKLSLIEKCLVGDASDNIKGIEGVGKEKVKRFLEGYKANAFLPQDLELLRINKDKIDLNRQLISLSVLPEGFKNAILARIERAASVAQRLSDNDDIVGDVVREYKLHDVKDSMLKLRNWDGA